MFDKEGPAMSAKPGQINPIARLLMISSSKLIFENMLQLWIQSSAFGISFDMLDYNAKMKALISIGLALAVSASKMFPLFKTTRTLLNNASCVGAFLVVILGIMPVICFCLLPWLWIVAKIYYAFHCDSHVWNLTSGCVVRGS